MTSKLTATDEILPFTLPPPLVTAEDSTTDTPDTISWSVQEKEAQQQPVSNNDSTEITGPQTGPTAHNRLKRYTLAFSLTNFGIGPVFGCANTYIVYQMQQIAYLGPGVGHNPGTPVGSGCIALDVPCLVPFGSRFINITSIFLYLNALCYAISGVICLFICGLGDYSSHKREQYIFGLIIYGCLALPIAGLTSYSLSTFNALAVIYTTFNTVGFLATAWLNIFVPFAMYEADPSDQPTTTMTHRSAPASSPPSTLHATPPKGLQAEGLPEELTENINTEEGSSHPREKNGKVQRGLKISVWGSNAMNSAMVIAYSITIGITYSSEKGRTFGGLYMTTTAGAICVLCALGGWRFLPSPRGKPLDGKVWKIPFTTFVSLFRGIWAYPEAFKLLIAFVIYNDSVFALSTVIGTLFNNIVRPSLTEYTAYSITGSLTNILAPSLLLYLYPRVHISLRKWTIGSYVVACFVGFWCTLGLSDLPIGFKHRVEFYIFQVLISASGSILSVSFRVLYPELFPRGAEIQYFGFQAVLSLSTVWIPQIVNGPIVEVTNNQRIPSVIALVFFLVSTVIAWWMKEQKV